MWLETWLHQDSVCATVHQTTQYLLQESETRSSAQDAASDTSRAKGELVPEVPIHAAETAGDELQGACKPLKEQTEGHSPVDTAPMSRMQRLMAKVHKCCWFCSSPKCV